MNSNTPIIAGLCVAAVMVIVLTSTISFIFGYFLHLKCKTKELKYQSSNQNQLYEEIHPANTKDGIHLTENSAYGRVPK